jgi:pimeloyl-ACP methyl ester carboxylesterase
VKLLEHAASGRHTVAVYEVKAGPAPTLLWLHALGGSAADAQAAASHWPGRLVALDFTAHGASPRPAGGAYTAELFVGDADAALAVAGEAFVAGRGLGAYVALLLAAARPERIPGALLLPGRGLDGGGAEPRWEQESPGEIDLTISELLSRIDRAEALPEDPMLRTVETDIRPPDYAREHADAARRLLFAEDGGERPPWWQAAREAASAEAAPGDLAAALAKLRSAAGPGPATG